MKKVANSIAPRRAFLRINVSLSVVALCLASIALASQAKQALAWGPSDGQCANQYGSLDCPPGGTPQGISTYNSYDCKQSSAWYYQSTFWIARYSCCLYMCQYQDCQMTTTGPKGQPITTYSTSEACYFQSKTNYEAHCEFLGCAQGPSPGDGDG